MKIKAFDFSSSLSGLSIRLLLFVIMGLLAHTSPSWSASSCSTRIFVSNFAEKSATQPACKTVERVFDCLNEESLFNAFAKDIEAAILAAAESEFCSNGYSIDIEFIRMPLVADQNKLGALEEKLSEIEGSYADISVDREFKSISVKVLWNPRRMLRDQLTLTGWEFEEEVPLLPFHRPDVKQFFHAWLHARMKAGRGNSHLAFEQLRDDVPYDMFGLSTLSEKSEPLILPFEPASMAKTWMIAASRVGYTALTAHQIGRGLMNKNLPPLVSLRDVEDAKFRTLYQSGEWNTGINPLK